MGIRHIDEVKDVFIQELHRYARLCADICWEFEELEKAHEELKVKLASTEGLDEKYKEEILIDPEGAYLRISGTRWSTLMNSTRTGTAMFKKAFTNNK